jgi:phenol 2-monooxygenase (NADPH)
MEGEQTDYVWGVVDMVPDTDFPDIRNRCVIHSNHGSCMVIPREGDIVRLYIQLEGKDMVDAAGRRIDKNMMEPLTLLEVRGDISRLLQLLRHECWGAGRKANIISLYD